MSTSTIDELIAKIKELPTSEVIARYVHVTRKGAQTLAVCPFHDDSNPSLNINDQKGMWYCFVDQLGGDSIKFVQMYKNLNFMDALKDICEALGWNFQDYVQEKKVSKKVEVARKILTNASILYKKIASSGTSASFKEFKKSRGLDDETASLYQLGLSASHNALCDYLSSIKSEDKTFAINLALELGLIKRSKYGDDGYYDTFRDRIMFPIWDQFGQVIGFTSRITKEGQIPKYMNSAESFLFNKKNLLYGLHLAKPFVREKDALILVEGNMDQIALFQSGFQHSVAIMGVGLGDSSLDKIKALTSHIYLCLDNDDAGWNAACRINTQFMEKGITPYRVDLGVHKDPDDFLKNEGAINFQEKLEGAIPFIDARIEKEFPKEIPSVAERRLELLNHFFELLSPLGTSLSATERVTKIAKRLNLQSDSQTIINTYKDFLENRPSEKPKYVPAEQTPPPPLNQENPSESFQQPVQKVELKHSVSSSEKLLLQFVVQNPELLELDESRELLDFVENSEVQKYIEELRNILFEIDEKEYVSVVQAINNGREISPELAGISNAALLKYHSTKLNEMVAKKMLSDIKLKLNEQSLRDQKEKLIQRQRLTHDQDELNTILRSLTEVDKKLQALKLGKN